MKLRLLLTSLIAILFLQACQQKKEVNAVAAEPKPKPIVQEKAVVTIPDSVSIAAVGDIMLGTSYPDSTTLPPDSAKNSFKEVAGHLKSADVTFGNLEGVLLDKGNPAHYKMHQRSKAYLFRMPVSYGTVLKDAGFNLLSLANNHIGDFDLAGRVNTTATLDSLGIHYAGLQTNPSVIFEVKGIKYGFCSFAPNANTVSILDLKGAGEIIRELKKNCDVVIVSFHGGGEGPTFEHVLRTGESYFGEKRGNVHAFAHNAIDNGADLIFGNGPHVSRAMELYKNRLIAYSLGNFCTYRCVSVEGVCGIAPLLKVCVNRKGEFLNGRIISIKQTHEKGLLIDSLHRAAARVKFLSETDIPENGLQISDTGVITPAAKELAEL